MKNMMKAMICALTITAAAAAIPAMVSARDNKEIYVTDSSALILRDQAEDNADIIFYAEGIGYELHVQDFMNGYGYCYSPDFGVSGWVDLADTYYDGDYDIDDVDLIDDDLVDDDLVDDDLVDDDLVDDDDFTQTLHSCVEDGYLALRSAPAYDDSNIIVKIYENGTALYMTGNYSGNYGYCYVPAFGAYGWVDVRFTY